MKVIDFSGTKHGKLLVIKVYRQDQVKDKKWECLCDCGNTVIITDRRLRSDFTTSCGCIYREDLLGKRFGMLLVIKYDKDDCYRTKYGWLCRCDCGKEKVITRGALLHKGTISCGCAKSTKECVDARRLPGYESHINTIYRRYAYGAKNRKLSFEITKEWVIKLITNKCFYCGEEPSSILWLNSIGFAHNGIDRLDSNVGYTVENTLPCCTTCNKMKMMLSCDYFLEKINKIYQYKIAKKG